MAAAIICDPCMANDCDNHEPGSGPSYLNGEPLIGGWVCVCRHDPDNIHKFEEATRKMMRGEIDER